MKKKTSVRKVRALTDKQLWFIWMAIQDLQGYLANSMEAGAEKCDKDYDAGTKARKLIQQQRRYLSHNTK